MTVAGNSGRRRSMVAMVVAPANRCYLEQRQQRNVFLLVHINVGLCLTCVHTPINIEMGQNFAIRCSVHGEEVFYTHHRRVVEKVTFEVVLSLNHIDRI